jgi:tetratricopeptide (TPR) repeat protein
MPDDNELENEVEQLEELLKQQPDSEQFTDLSKALMALGKYDQAVKVSEKGIGYNPGLALGHLVYGMALIHQKKRDEGLQAFERACTLKMNDIGLLAEIGHFLVEVGLAEVAYPYLDKGKDIDPSDQRILSLEDKIDADEQADDLRQVTRPISVEENLAQNMDLAVSNDQEADNPWDESNPDQQTNEEFARVPTEEIQWPGWDSNPPPPTDAFDAEPEQDQLDQDLDDDEDLPPTVYTVNPLAAQQAGQEQADELLPVPDEDSQAESGSQEQPPAESQESDQAGADEGESQQFELKTDQETIADPSAGLRAEVDQAMNQAVKQKDGEPPTMFDPGQPGQQPWAEEKGGPKDPSLNEPPTMFEDGRAAQGSGEAPPTKFSTAPDGALAPFREAVSAPAETFSYFKVFLVLVPFLVAGLALGGYFAYSQIKEDKVLNFLEQAKSSIGQDTFYGYSEARITLTKMLEIDEEHKKGKALMALTCARLSDEYGPNLELKEESQKLIKELAAGAEFASDLFQARLHLEENENLETEVADALKLSPEDPDLLALAGELAVKRKDSKKAIEYFEKSLSQEPSNARVLYLLGNQEVESGHKQKAKEYLERALAINGIHVRSILLISKLRLLDGQGLERVKDDLEKVVELPRVTNRRRAQAHYLLSRLSFSRFERSRAVSQVKAALELVPDDMAFQKKLAELCLEYFELDEAAKRAAKVLEENPDDIQTQLLMIATYLPRGKAAKAIAELDKLIGKRVPAATFLILRGEALLQLERYPAALQDLNSVSDKTPEKTRAKALAILAELGSGNKERAYRKVIALVSDHSELGIVHYALGHYRLSKRLTRSAAAAFNEAIKKDPLNYQAYTQIALIAMGSGKKKVALELAENALKINPYHVDAWSLVGKIKLINADAKGALEAYYRIVSEDSNSQEGYVGMAEALLAQKQIEKALLAIDKAIRAGSEEAHTFHLRGKIFLAMGKFFKATRALSKAKRIEDKDAEILADLGLAQLGARSITRAEKNFKESLKRKRLVRAQEGMASVLNMRRKYKDAAKAYEKAALWAIRKDWEKSEIGRLYMAGGNAWVKDKKTSNNFGRARRLFKKAAGFLPDDPEPLYQIGAAYDRDDKISLARKTYLSVLEKDEQHAATLYRLGLLEFDEEHDEQAKEYLERFLKTNPKGSDAKRARKILKRIK